MKNKNIFILLFVLCLAAFNIVNYDGQVKGVSDESLVLYVLDIGQGSATLIRTPEGDDILIDGGPNNTLVGKLGQYLPFFDRTIEKMIITHPDSDHLVGLIEVLNRYQVEEIITTGVSHDSINYQVFKNSIDPNTNITIIDKPQTIDLSQSVKFEILWPKESWENKSSDNINNTSIAGRIVYKDTSIMTTGDLEQEEDLVDMDIDLKSDIYIVGHHGANNANDLEFIRQVDPDYSLISAGEDNKFGHPNYRTVRNLEIVDSEIIGTYDVGDIVFITNGDEFYRY